MLFRTIAWQTLAVVALFLLNPAASRGATVYVAVTGVVDSVTHPVGC